MNGKRYSSTYDKQFTLFSSRIERYLRLALAALLLALLVAQALLTIPAIRHAITRIDPLEGVPYRQAASSGDRAGADATAGE